MTFAGLPLLGVLAAAFATTGAVIGLYLLRPTPHTVIVSNALFWVKAAQKARARLLFSRRIPLLAFLLTLAIAILLAVELGDPRFGAGVRGLTVVVYVADRSMAAADGGTTRTSNAHRLLRDIVQQATARGRVAVVRAGIRPSVLVGLTEHPGDLERALAGGDPVDEGAADLDAAVGLADGIVRHAGEVEARIVVLGDRAPRAPQGMITPLLFIPIGHAGETVAITAFGARRDPQAIGEYVVFAEVHAFTSHRARVRIEIRDRDVVLSEQELTLAAGQTVTHHAQGFSSARGELTARLENVRIDGTDDALGLDDRAYAVVEPIARMRVLLVTGGDRYLRDVFAANPSIALTVEAPNALPSAGAGGALDRHLARYDVVVFDRWAPRAQLRHSGLLLIEPPDGAQGVHVTTTLQNPRITAWLTGHPLLDKVRLDQVVVRRSEGLATTAADAVIIRADREAIAIAREREGRRSLVLGFDTDSTDLVQRIAFPIFMHDAVTWLAHESGGYRSYALPADPIRVAGNDTTVLLPDGTARSAHGSFYETGQAGIYHAGERAVAVSGVDSSRALISPTTPAADASLGRLFPPLGVLLALVLLAFMCFEWTFLHRGWLS